MDIRENTHVRESALEYMRKKYLTPKPFPHVAELIYCLTKSYYDRTDPIPPQDKEVLLFSLGFGLEKVMLPDDYKSKSKQVNGVYYTPDLAIEDELTEIKTTRMKYTAGTVKVPETWLQQCKAYCFCEKCNEMSLAILHITGDYKPPFPLIAGYTLHFSDEELSENWNYILDRRGSLERAITTQQLPEPYKFCQDWECDWCRYKLRCQSIGAKNAHREETELE